LRDYPLGGFRKDFLLIVARVQKHRMPHTRKRRPTG
jgi:hypothetical protein